MIGAEIFVHAAASRLVQQAEVDQLIIGGLEVIACGANPDFISNCGMARIFAYLMQRNVEMSDDAIFTDASDVIYKAM